MEINLGPDGGFELTLPSGRKLSVPNTEFTSAFIYKILWDGAHGEERKGYIGSYPTQAITDKWLSNAAARASQDEWMRDKAAERIEEFNKTQGKVEFDI